MSKSIANSAKRFSDPCLLTSPRSTSSPLLIQPPHLIPHPHLTSTQVASRLAYIGALQFGPQKLKEKDQVLLHLLLGPLTASSRCSSSSTSGRACWTPRAPLRATIRSGVTTSTTRLQQNMFCPSHQQIFPPYNLSIKRAKHLYFINLRQKLRNFTFVISF